MTDTHFLIRMRLHMTVPKKKMTPIGAPVRAMKSEVTMVHKNKLALPSNKRLLPRIDTQAMMKIVTPTLCLLRRRIPEQIRRRLFPA